MKFFFFINLFIILLIIENSINVYGFSCYYGLNTATTRNCQANSIGCSTTKTGGNCITFLHLSS
ncbi:hypothetical protein Mgra_00009435 [Meloidogyne graminicola]|uniref:Uncharacterized protein n=1 Tax=Meloidogyne graminicola TaxID=189291 RepID=A0A8S9Z9V9_9BILA|nr:hypothetical protein Mgra_00009435 [Meloidogyne graminicola]